MEDGFNLGWLVKLLIVKFYYLSVCICIMCKVGVLLGWKQFRYVLYFVINCFWFELKIFLKS